MKQSNKCEICKEKYPDPFHKYKSHSQTQRSSARNVRASEEVSKKLMADTSSVPYTPLTKDRYELVQNKLFDYFDLSKDLQENTEANNLKVAINKTIEGCKKYELSALNGLREDVNKIENTLRDSHSNEVIRLWKLNKIIDKWFPILKDDEVKE